MNLNNLKNIENIEEPGFDDEPTGLGYQDYNAQDEIRKIKFLAKIAAKYDADVTVAVIVEAWEDYVGNRLCAIAEYPVQSEEFKGIKRTECFISLQNKVEVAQMERSLYKERTVVINPETKEIIASHPAFFY